MKSLGYSRILGTIMWLNVNRKKSIILCDLDSESGQRYEVLVELVTEERTRGFK